ncbi:MAG TPA: hypothetical protein VGH27_01650 [Streptosporangiaceae bacterium]|jgi:hypothetical protein
MPYRYAPPRQSPRLAASQPQHHDCGPNYTPLDSPLPMLAEHARTLASHGGPCKRCGHALLAGERAADLPGGGGTVHLGCVGKVNR